MEVHDLDVAFRELLEAASSDAGSFEDNWKHWQEEAEPFQEQPALLVEIVLGGAPDATVLKAVQDSVSDDRQGSKTRRAIFKWLLALVQELEPAKLQQYASAIFEAVMARVRASAKAEDIPTKVAGLELLSFILAAELSGQLQAHMLPDAALDCATQLQRVCLSSDARNSKTLKPAFLGVIGLLLQLSALPPPQQQQGEERAAAAAAAASSSSTQHVQRCAEQLKWLLQLCEQELGASRVAAAGAAAGAGARLRFDAAQANEGAIQSMTAVLSMMQPFEAGQGGPCEALSAALDLAAALLQELAAAIASSTSDPNRRPRMYGKYTAAMQLLQQLGGCMAAAGLLQPAAAGAGAGTSASTATADGPSLVLLRSLMIITAGSPNASAKKAAATTLTTLAELMCGELLKLEPGSPAALDWLVAGMALCAAELAGGGAGAAAAAAAGPGSGWTRAALEVIGALTPAVARHQGLKVWGPSDTLLASAVWRH